MANKKITQLTDLPKECGADILAIVDDVAGTPTTKKVTVTNLMGQASASNLSSYDFNGIDTTLTLLLTIKQEPHIH